MDLETGWSPQLLSSSRNLKIQKGSNGYVDASAGVTLLQVPSTINRGEVIFTFLGTRITGWIRLTGSKLQRIFVTALKKYLLKTEPSLKRILKPSTIKSI